MTGQSWKKKRHNDEDEWRKRPCQSPIRTAASPFSSFSLSLSLYSGLGGRKGPANNTGKASAEVDDEHCCPPLARPFLRNTRCCISSAGRLTIGSRRRQYMHLRGSAPIVHLAWQEWLQLGSTLRTAAFRSETLGRCTARRGGRDVP